MTPTDDDRRAARAAPAATNGAWLSDDTTGIRLSLPSTRNKMTIGRDPACDLRLRAPDASRWHAVLVLRNDLTWQIDDTNSANGTYVSGSLITAPTILTDGDTIQLGETTLVYHDTRAGVSPEPSSRSRKRNALGGAIVAALILYVIGLLANSLNTYFARLDNTLLTWLLPNAVGAIVVVIGAIVNHARSAGQDSGLGTHDSSPPPGNMSMAGVLAVLVVLGVVALGLTLGVRYAVGYLTGNEPPTAERFNGQKHSSSGDIDLTVTRIFETKHFTQVEVTARNTGPRPEALPLGFCSLNGSGHTLEADQFRSQWTTVLPTDLDQTGRITFLGHLSGDAQSATLSFTFGEQHQVKRIKLQARD